MSMDPFTSQQPAWISASTAEMETRVRTFVRGVYAWMFGGLLLTTLAALWVVVSPAMQAIVLHNPVVMIGLIVAEFAIVLFLSFGLTRMTAATAASAFLVYSFLNGLTLSVIFWVYAHGSIVLAFLTAAGMFGALSIYGLVTKRNLAPMATFFFMGLVGLVIAMVINVFLHSSAMSFMIAVIGIIVFAGLTVWDNQKLRSMATVTGPMQENLAIIGALALYLDFINLFLFLLRLFGDRRR